MYLNANTGRGGARVAKCRNGTLKDALSEKLSVSKNTILRDAKFAQAVDAMPGYRNDILTGVTDRKKQELTDIYDFMQIEHKPYEVELHIVYNNPEEVKKHTAIFKKIDALTEKYESYELHRLVKTDKTKEEDGREFVYYDIEDVEINVREKILELINENDIQDVEQILLSHIKEHLNIKPLWKPSISEDEYKRMLEIERQEAILEERKRYTPKVINGDTLKEITKIETESIDLIITDPPYNMDKADWDSYGSAEEFADWMELWLKECFRVLKQHGSIYVFGLNRMLSHVQMRMEKIGFKYKNWIIWDTVQGAGGGLWVNRQEAILYFSKSDTPFENKDAIKLYRAEENIREYKGKTYEFKNPSNIWRFPVVDDKSADRTTHPTQKPVELIERMIKANSKEDDTILDCFMGSGTTGVAAMKNRRRSIGFEMEKEYVSIAKDRFEKVEI